MIFGNVDVVEGIEKKYPEPIVRAIKHFKSRQHEFLAMSAGTYPIDGEDLFVQVVNAVTKKKAEIRPEVHRKYIDIQFSVEGKEIIGFVPDMGQNIVVEDLARDKDVIYYADVENEIDLVMEKGSFVVLFPEDVHRPGCEYGGCTTIRKVVIKVNTAIL